MANSPIDDFQDYNKTSNILGKVFDTSLQHIWVKVCEIDNKNSRKYSMIPSFFKTGLI